MSQINEHIFWGEADSFNVSIHHPREQQDKTYYTELFHKIEQLELNLTTSKGWVYLLYDGISETVKAGMTTAINLDRCRRQIRSSSVPLFFLAAFRVADCRSAETWIHREFSSERINGEWFKVKPALMIERIVSNLSFHFSIQKNGFDLADYSVRCSQYKEGDHSAFNGYVSIGPGGF